MFKSKCEIIHSWNYHFKLRISIWTLNITLVNTRKCSNDFEMNKRPRLSILYANIVLKLEIFLLFSKWVWSFSQAGRCEGHCWTLHANPRTSAWETEDFRWSGALGSHNKTWRTLLLFWTEWWVVHYTCMNIVPLSSYFWASSSAC